MRRQHWYLIAGFATPIILVVVLVLTGVLRAERVAIMRAQCTSCSMVTNMLFYRISFRSVSVNLPYGMEVYGGTSYCPHTLVYP